MTRDEWLASEDPVTMLSYAQGEDLRGERLYPLSDRKLRLFACACVGRYWDGLSAPLRGAVLVGRRFADAEVSQEGRVATERALPRPLRGVELAASYCVWPEETYLVASVLRAIDEHEHEHDSASGVRREITGRANAALLREVVGDPFAPVPLPRGEAEVRCDSCGRSNPTVTFRDMRCLQCGRGIARVMPGRCPWLTPTVLHVARAIYDGRAFGELSVLSDALEDAGCTSADVLTHLRSPGPHVRGCWALDLILGKE